MALYSYLEPDILNRIFQRKFVLFRAPRDLYNGLHASRSRGGGIDFLQHREYYPGDDPKNIDWRLSARRDHVYIREYEAENSITAAFLLDESGSMDFASGKECHTKHEYAKRLISHLSFFFLNQRDRVRLVRLRRGTPGVLHRPPYSHSYRQVIRALEVWKCSGMVPLSALLTDALRRSAGARIQFVFSDFIDTAFLEKSPPASFDAGPGMTVLIKINDPSEIAFPYRHYRRFQDPETGERILADPAKVREQYLASFMEHTAVLVEYARRTGGRLVSVSTDDLLEVALDRILASAGGR